MGKTISIICLLFSKLAIISAKKMAWCVIDAHCILNIANILSSTGLGTDAQYSSSLDWTQENSKYWINGNKCSLRLQSSFYENLLSPPYYISARSHQGWLLMLQNESFTQRKNGKWWYVHHFFGLRLFCCCCSTLATWHQYHFVPVGTDLTNHSSVLNKYYSEQCCWEETYPKGLLIVD